MLDFNASRTALGAALSPATSAAVPSKKDLPKATAWINVGYTVSLQMTDGSTEERFVSIPVGIPLDTMDPINITSRNTEYAQFQAAQNDLLQQLKDFAAGKNAGDASIMPLEVQLRRINGPAEVPAADESNPFAAKLRLA